MTLFVIMCSRLSIKWKESVQKSITETVLLPTNSTYIHQTEVHLTFGLDPGLILQLYVVHTAQKMKFSI